MAGSMLTALGLPSALSKKIDEDSTVADDIAGEEKTLTKTKLPKRETGSFDKTLKSFLSTKGAKVKDDTLTIGKKASYKITNPKAGVTVFTKLSTIVPIDKTPKPVEDLGAMSIVTKGLGKATIKHM